MLDIVGLLTRHAERGGFVGVVFRLRPLSGEPRPDGVEIDRVAYFSEEEIQRLESELEYAKGFLTSVQKKLSNENFVKNAPAQVVEKERQKMTDAAIRIMEVFVFM